MLLDSAAAAGARRSGLRGKEHRIPPAFDGSSCGVCLEVFFFRGYRKKLTRFSPPNSDRIPADVLREVAFSPQNALLEEIVGRAADSLNVTLRGLPNARSLESALMDNDTLVGVEFDDSLASATTLPAKLIFALRFPGELRTSSGNVFPNWRRDC